MSDDEPEQDAAEATDDSDEQDDPTWPLNRAAAKFSVAGRALDFDAFVAETAGPLAERPRHRPVQQPAPQPKDIVWQARRPA